MSPVKIKRVDFSDPQGGKCICDRKADHIKGYKRRHVNEGNNVVTADEFRKAVSTMSNVKVVVGSLPESKSNTFQCPELDSISNLNNFTFDNRSMTVWRQYDVGKGHTYSYKKIGLDVNGHIPSLDALSMSELHIKAPKQKQLQELEPQQSSVHEEIPTVEDGSNLFTCPEEGCICTFINYGNMVRHLDVGKHSFPEENINLKDRACILYSELIETKSLQVDPVVRNELIREMSNSLTKGWGLKGKREVKRFSQDQKAFLEQKFQQGEVTGHKCEPEEVAVEMRTTRDKDGRRRFKCADFLTPTQIASYFCRLALKKRQTANTDFVEEDLRAEEATNELANLCTTVIDN